jgi:selenocysteine lyase/cysteine desulfurase
MPEAMPDRLEAGTGNAPGMAGLVAGIDEVRARGVERIHAELSRLKARLRSGLADLPGVRVLSPTAPGGAPIVTATVDALTPSALAERLDREWGVEVRAGLHCAPRVHRLLGTAETGAVRFSLGWASTDADVERALEGVEAMAVARPGAISSS